MYECMIVGLMNINSDRQYLETVYRIFMVS